MLRAVDLAIPERTFFSLSPSGSSLIHCKNNLPELDFMLDTTSLTNRPESIVCNGLTYPVNWTKNPRAYHQVFEQADYFIDKKKDYYGAQKKLYYLLKDSLCFANARHGINGHVLVRAFMQLSKIFQKLEQWENAIDAANLASDLNPYDNAANLAVAFLCSDHGNSFHGYRYSEEAVSLEPGSLSARKCLVGLASKEELYYVAGQHAKVSIALEDLRQRPHKASTHIKLAGAYFREGDYDEALKVLEQGVSSLNGDEQSILENYLLCELGWTKPSSVAA